MSGEQPPPCLSALPWQSPRAAYSPGGPRSTARGIFRVQRDPNLMKPAMLAFLAMLLVAPSTAYPRAVEVRPAAPGGAPSPAQGQPQKPAPAKPAPAADAPQGQRAAERKRRMSYARCNRLSHEKNLRGGARRRFMIRCRLGYEKPRQPPAPPAALPAQPPQIPPPAQTAPTPPPQAPAAPAPAKRP